MKKRICTISLILLVFHIGVVIPKMKFECSCHEFPELFSPCCNCSHCVSQRGGFLSACRCHDETNGTSEKLPLIKRAICFCGFSNGDFDLPGLKCPVILNQNPFPPPVLEIHPYFQVPSTLSSQVYLTPPDHPS